MEARQDRLLVVGERLQQSLLLSPCDGDDGAVTRCELTLRLSVLHKLEGLQVFRPAELVVAVAVAVVHDDPRLAVDGLADADTLYRLLRLLHVAVEHLPLVRQLLGHGLIDAASRLLLIKEVVQLVGLVVDDVAVDGGVAGIEEPARLTLQVRKILVGILVVDLVVRLRVAGAHGIKDHVLAGLVVVDGLWCPYAYDVLPRLRVACGEIDGRVLPIDKVGRLQQHHAAVARPAETRLHVGYHHVERLAVLTAQDVWVAHALCQGYRVALNDGCSHVQRRVVIAVVADGVAYLLVLRGVAVEIGEEVGHHLVRVLGLFGGSLFLARLGGGGSSQQDGQ